MTVVRTRREVAALAGLLASGSIGESATAASGTRPQNPGFQRRRFGAVEVTALSDGAFPPNPEIFGTGRAAAEAAASRSPQRDALRGHVNAYAIEAAGQLALVDAGAPAWLAPGVGRLPLALAAAGFETGDFDAVLLTHLHLDHIGALFDARGTGPALPRARLFLSAEELAYWERPQSTAASAEQVTAVRTLFTAYRGRIETFDGAAQVFPAVRAVPLIGHTPGHTGFLVSNGAAPQILLWGDVVHAPEVQFAVPQVGVIFDVDGALARDARLSVLAQMAESCMEVAGAHLPFPGFGYVVRQEGRAYGFVPAYWQHSPAG